MIAIHTFTFVTLCFIYTHRLLVDCCCLLYPSYIYTLYLCTHFVHLWLYIYTFTFTCHTHTPRAPLHTHTPLPLFTLHLYTCCIRPYLYTHCPLVWVVGCCYTLYIWLVIYLCRVTHLLPTIQRIYLPCTFVVTGLCDCYWRMTLKKALCPCAQTLGVQLECLGWTVGLPSHTHPHTRLLPLVHCWVVGFPFCA